MQRGGERESRGVLAECGGVCRVPGAGQPPGHAGGEVLQVSQVQQPGLVIDVEPVAERRQRRAHVGDGVPVFLDVLGRGQQGCAQCAVLGRAGAARRRSR